MKYKVFTKQRVLCMILMIFIILLIRSDLREPEIKRSFHKNHEFLQSMALPESDLALLKMAHLNPNAAILGHNLRQFKHYWKLHQGHFQQDLKHHYQQQKLNEILINNINHFDRYMFDWLKVSTIDLYQTFENHIGVVLHVDNRNIGNAISTIGVIREIHSSNIPIEVYYKGRISLSIQDELRFKFIKNVVLIDVTKLMNIDITEIDGLDIKPFAMLFSKFQHVLAIDIDIVFLQSPESLFQSSIYEKYHALFYVGRSIGSVPKSSQQWISSLLEKPIIDNVKNLRIMNGLTMYEQDAAVVLINKKENFIGLLSTCLLNLGFKDTIENHSLNIHESFWIGFDIVRNSYTFNKYLTGAAGSIQSVQGVDVICSSSVLHVDENRNPIWYNISLHTAEDSQSQIQNFTHWQIEPSVWTGNGDEFCISVRNHVSSIKKADMNVMEMARELFISEDRG
ncbi:mannosyltransferase putative-domain-containing protein [Globomyces pollinis-pini]|nr:mannosyltransferase putative-domain-containing protein [Globomyces pollinis-pini]